MSRRSSWDGDAAAGLTMAAVLLTIIIIIAVGKLALMTLKEIGRVYLENAANGSAMRQLWYALGSLCGLWLVCGITAAAVPVLGAVCAYSAAWGFLAYVVAIEVVDWQGQRGSVAGPIGDLSSYTAGLGPSRESQSARRAAADSTVA